MFPYSLNSRFLSQNLSRAPVKRSLQPCQTSASASASKQTEKRSNSYERTPGGFNLILLPVAEPEIRLV